MSTPLQSFFTTGAPIRLTLADGLSKVQTDDLVSKREGENTNRSMIKVETAHGLGDGGKELGRSEGGVGTKS